MSSLRLNDLRFLDTGNLSGIAQWKTNLAERLIRAILCAGFIAVLAVEVSLLIHALRIYG